MSDDPYHGIGLKTYMRLQILEIDEHKWYLSKWYGYDVGYSVAVQSFIDGGFADLFRLKFEEHHKELYESQKSGELERLILEHDADLLHKYLKDGEYKNG